MIVIAGGIGSGKSVVARMLRLRGYGVLDCDSEASLLMNTSPAVIEDVRRVSGHDVYREETVEGSRKLALDRKLLASRIFSEEEVRKEINRTVHRAVRERIEEWLGESKANVFVETAIAADSGIDRMAGEVWFVTADKAVRLERVLGRDNRTREEVERIMEIQEKELERLEASNVKIRIIRNNPDSNIMDRLRELGY